MKEIPITKIKPSTTNPRQDLGDLSELVASIKSRIEQGKRGIIEPLIVKQLTEAPEDTYQLVIGTRRFEAAKQAGLKIVPCLIEDFDTEDAMVAGLIENDQRKDLEWYERAKVYKKLRGELLKEVGTVKYFERKTEDIAKLVGKSKQFVVEHLLSLEVLEREATAIGLDVPLLREIHRAPKEHWEFLVEKVLEGLTQPQLAKIISQANKMKSRVELLEATDLKIAKEIWGFWKDFQYESGAYRDMEYEIKVRTGKYPSKEFFYPEERFTKEEIEKYAKEHGGEYLGTITRSWHRAFHLPYTIKELREKWKTKAES